jgi:alkanesulfonate monooxygenase SsuD/methylene tetrahydromethanopterin reductase-like flavin-dependent oxidoreductase (luciferase family)
LPRPAQPPAGVEMEFAYFHFMPYTAIKESGDDWPVPNRYFDPATGTRFYETYIANMVYAEECGFDWLACNEHHLSPYGLMANPNLIGSALIQRTRRAKIAVVGNLIPLLNPVRVAEEYAMLDVMSGGRLIAGILRGIPHEYVAYNIPPDESHERLLEALALIKKAWTEPEPFGWEGQYYQFRALSIWPRPVQTPFPRILMSGSNKVSAELAARSGAILGISAVSDLKVAKQLIKVYRDTAQECGRHAKQEDILIGMLCCVADTDCQAIATLESGRKYFAEVLAGGLRTAQALVLQKTRYFDEVTRTKFEDVRKAFGANVNDMLKSGTVLCGSPERVAEQIEGLHRELGMGVLMANMQVGNIPEDAVRYSLNAFGTTIIPALRHL